ncbi:MAG: tetratricopeptide repeat protein [Saprospiraceae bacterium]
MSSEPKQPSLLQELWDRRFFQYVGTYLGLSFGLLQFMDFLVNRYQLNSSLVDKLFIFLLAMLPAVIVIAYNHGRPGRDRWRSFEKILLPGSLVIGLMLAVLLFNDSAAQAATEKISISTIDGKQETRVIPKVEYTKRFAIFPFENLTQDATQEWIRVGIPFLLDKDMEQFMMNYSINPLSMKRQYEDNNAVYLQKLPFATQLKIAQGYYTDFFITGNFRSGTDETTLAIKVYNSKNGQLFFETEVAGSDIYDTVDQLTVALDEYLYLKDNIGSLDVIDLPASNLVTSDPEAFRDYIEGLVLARMDIRKIGQAVESLERAVSEDSNCATCFAGLSELYYGMSDETKMKNAAGKAVALSGPLPERQRLLINYQNYQANNEWNKAELLLNNWCRLYPHDYTPFSILMNSYLTRQLWGKAEKVGLQALQNGHKGQLLYSLATIYISKGEFDEAEKYTDQYYKAYPNQSKDKSLLEKIYSGRGELKKAKELYENELVMDPGNVDMLVKLGTLEDQLGNFQKSLSYYQEALQKAVTTQDSVKTLQAEEAHFERLGQYNRSFEIADRRYALMGTYIPPAQLKQVRFFNEGNKLAMIGRREDYFANLDALKEELPQNAALFDCVGNYLFHMYADNLEEFENYSDKCSEAYLTPMYGTAFKHMDAGARAEMNGDFATAIREYEAYMDSTGLGNLRMAYGLASMYRQNGQPDIALEKIEASLKLDPHQPIYILEKAMILFDQGKRNEAEELYQKVMDIWKDADTDFKYYEEAVEFGEKLQKAG